MANEKKNSVTLFVLAFIIGIGLGVWGMIKADCIGTNCWVGSGFLKWAGGILIAVGLIGFFTAGSSKG